MSKPDPTIPPPTRPCVTPRLCFVGPMLGKNKGWVLSQGEILAGLFARAGYPVRMTSTIPNRFLRLADILRSLVQWRREIDIVIVMVFSGPAFTVSELASRLAKRLRLPLILALHGGNLPNFARRNPQRARSVLRLADAIVSPSNYLASFFQDWGFDVRVIPNVLSVNDYPFKHRTRVEARLLWMRTFEDGYYPEMAIYTLEDLLKTHPQACLTMAGQDRGRLAPLKKMVEQKGLQNCVRFAGFLDLAGKRREFSAHDIFLNTNRVDNTPVSVLEAAAFGLPIVTTAVGGIPFLLAHEQTALLVQNEDAQGMANAVRRLINEPGLCATLSARGRQLAESCDWPRVKAGWEQIFAAAKGRT